MSRATAHKKGVALLAEGKYGEATRALRHCVDQFGAHVGPLSDLIFAAYLHQDMGAFHLAVEQLETEFPQALPKLSPKSAALTRIALAKAFELQGRLAESLDEIERVLSLLPKGKGDIFVTQAKCQKLRLLASLGRENEIGPLYRECLGLSEASPQAMIECFHALLLAEARLFGLAATWPRFLHLARSPGLQSADQRLCLVDLLEIAIERQNAESQGLILDYFARHDVGEPDQYEAAVLQMARHSDRAFTADDIFHWKRTIPYFGLVRLMALELTRGGRDPAIRKQFIFFVQCLDHRSRRLVNRKWPALLAGEDTPVLTLKKGNLYHGGSTLSFGKSPQTWALLGLLSEQKEIAPAALLRALGKSDNLQNSESLRISVLRLNKKLAALAGVDWVIKFGKEKVAVNPKVRWEKS